MAIAMKVTVSPERIALGPGESADVELTVQNASQVVEHFTARVAGLPSADLATCEPDVVKLRPKEVGTLRMRISVPERGGMVAGQYTLGLVVKSPYSREVSRCEELPLDVRPAPVLTMNVQPEVANGGKVGNYVVNLANEGNMPMAVTLSGTDPENRVGFKFAPREIRLEPGMVAGSQVTVNSDQPLTGQEKRRSATLRANAGETVVEKPVSFVQRPKIRGGWMKFGALAAGLAVLGGATVGGALLLRDIKNQNVTANTTPAAQQSAQQPQQQPQNQQNPSQQQQTPQPSAPPQNPSSAPPSQPPQNSQPSAPPPAQPGQPQQVPTVDFVSFERKNDQQPVDVNLPIGRDYYAESGLTMTNLTDKAPAICKNATQQWLRISRAGTTNNNPVAGANAYLSTGVTTNPRDCNVLSVLFTFNKPLSSLNVFFTGLPTVKYVATATFMDGTKLSQEAVCPKIGDSTAIGFQVPPGKPAIKEVEFGRHPAVQPAAESITMLKGIGYTQAP